MKGLDPHSRTEAAPMTIPESTNTIDDGPVLIAGRYALLSLLGSGAMGTVYRASDTELDEIVALKVLKKELAGSADMLERFRREVKLARRVTHRNVARTFDIGEHLGDRFLTMEYIAGQMLAIRLERYGRLDPHEAAAIARDIAGGLAAAHAAGVVHRDLKPENVVIATDGRAVITDFGIARALAEAEHARGGGLRGRPAATFAGAIVGTPAYMAPEQVEGRADLDARADLYALGVMLYELATGETPWPGDSAFSVAAARLLNPPPDPRKIVPDLPDTFVAIVHKLMARDREERFESAEETARALAVVGSGLTRTLVTAPRVPVRVAQKRIAVMPIANLGELADNYLADAVGEELADRLGTLPGVAVTARGDTQRLAGLDAREAGRALGVDAVISGSVRRTGKTVKIALRLVTVQDGFQLWSRHI